MAIRSASPLACFAGAGCIFALLFLLFTDATTPGITLAWSNRDFANYWIAARLAVDGQAQDLFGPHDVYFGHMRSAFGPDYPWHNWSYPPHYLLTVLPLGLLGYKTAMILYLLTTFLLLCSTLRLVSPRPSPIQLLLLLPALAANVLAAQNGFLTAALLLAGLALRAERPVLAGICIALLTIKPQLGFLLPLLLLYERRWLVIATASATTGLLLLSSVAVFGLSSWQGYVADVLPYQSQVMRMITGIFPHMMPSAFGSLRSLGQPADLAMAVHLPVAALAVCVHVASLLRLKTSWGRAASTVFAIFVITPYSVTYDLVALAAIAAMWPLGDAARPGPALRAGLAGVALMPILAPALGGAGWPVASILIPAAWLLLLRSEGFFRGLTPRSNPAGA